jgi:hypothetical protein
MRAVLRLERRRQPRRHRRERPGVRRHLPRQRDDRIGSLARGVVPAFDRRRAEPDHFAGRRVFVGLPGQLGDPCAQLAVFGGGRQQRPDDREP